MTFTLIGGVSDLEDANGDGTTLSDYDDYGPRGVAALRKRKRKRKKITAGNGDNSTDNRHR